LTIVKSERMVSLAYTSLLDNFSNIPSAPVHGPKSTDPVLS